MDESQDDCILREVDEDLQNEESRPAVGYSSIWLNRPVADSARIDVFKMAAGIGELHHLRPVSDSEKQITPPSDHQLSTNHSENSFNEYIPWLGRIPPPAEKLLHKEVHMAAQRAFKKRKVFNGLLKHKPSNMQTDVSKRQGNVPYRLQGFGATHNGARVRLPKMKHANVGSQNGNKSHQDGSLGVGLGIACKPKQPNLTSSNKHLLSKMPCRLLPLARRHQINGSNPSLDLPRCLK